VVDDASHYRWLAACYARGTLRLAADVDDDLALLAAQQRGLRLHRFKRASELPRVRAVLGTLRGLAPANLLDVGSGRGVFLWPMLDSLLEVPVTAVDKLDQRAAGLAAVARGGVTRLTAARMDAGRLGFASGAFDVATVLEVLEHVPDPPAVAAELLRVSRRAIVATVPSQPDDNPEHVRLFTAASLEQLWRDAGARRVTLDGVRGHLTAVVLT
jgi:2-polyprenyl-3-methyl-5-hydroxy-6-metoxy-1,4-benzoquinol methylase